MTQILPYSFAKTHKILIEEKSGQRILYTSSNTNLSALGEASRFGHPDRVVCMDETEMNKLVQQAYAQSEGAVALAMNIEPDADLSRLMQDLPEITDLLDTGDDAPIVRMLNALLTQAAKDGASDIHIEPYERHSSVRFRVDGRLREVVQPNRALHAAMISRLKIMAELDIAEKRLPQDGRISLRIGAKSMDARVSTLPGPYGERAVLRLLDKSEGSLNLESLGMRGDILSTFDHMLRQPHGIILVTGPTGSGKTTTLYAGLQRMDSVESNIMTVEDPIEYELSGIGQTQVNAKIDLTFAKALRSILRQDPDIIMIGEIRDHETAQIAIQASLTGHLVLATLHTNDAASAVTRLADMGIEPYLLSSSLLGVLAQRLARKVCKSCQGSGCLLCGQTGYQGRTGIFELLSVDEPIKTLIHDKASDGAITQSARDRGMRSMREHGEELVLEGLTTREELLRVTKD